MKKKIISIVVILLLIAGGTIAYLYMTDMKQEEILIQEVNKISELDLSSDDVDMDIKTKGDYAIVEKAIKGYIHEYSNITKATINIMNDEKVEDILSIENYKKDGPDFVETKKYVENSKKEFNDNIQKLIELTNEESIKKNIEKANLTDNYYLELYNNLMLGEEMSQDLKDTEAELVDSKEMLNEVYDTQENVIDFLVKNKGKWSIEGDELQFESDDLANKYEELIDSLPKE